MKSGAQSGLPPTSAERRSSEPLPCPHCGEAGTSLTVDSDIESVVCDGCKATGPSLLTARDFDTEEEMYASVVAAWNVRASFWIPVSVRLPERGALVLAKLTLGTPLLARFYGTDWERESTGDTVSVVTHWAPLPGAQMSGTGSREEGAQMKQQDTTDPAESVLRCIQCENERRARFLRWCLENVPGYAGADPGKPPVQP